MCSPVFSSWSLYNIETLHEFKLSLLHKYVKNINVKTIYFSFNNVRYGWTKMQMQHSQRSSTFGRSEDVQELRERRDSGPIPAPLGFKNTPKFATFVRLAAKLIKTARRPKGKLFSFMWYLCAMSSLSKRRISQKHNAVAMFLIKATVHAN